MAAAARKLETSSLKRCCKLAIKDWLQEQVLNKTPTLKICVKKLDFWWFSQGDATGLLLIERGGRKEQMESRA